jgi:hypothetical protein
MEVVFLSASPATRIRHALSKAFLVISLVLHPFIQNGYVNTYAEISDSEIDIFLEHLFETFQRFEFDSRVLAISQS